ncbi:MAG TPA: hypothetical protein DD490_18635 [Acidobacteria bacterium]|nr:hypothetical protein [Acidobacteriota bacterium]
MKRIVICLDGTWNSPEQDKDDGKGTRPRYKPTNVLKTFRSILPTAEDGTPQVAFYLEGVGSSIGEPERFSGLQKWTDKLLGGAFGGGFEARIKSAYRFLVANYEPGDKIYVFGFSRGAAQAQSLTRFIDWNGGLLHKSDEFYIPELFQGYRETEAGSGTSAGVREAIRRRRGKPEAILDPRPVEVTFLGVYDTVLAVGTRLGADRDEEGVPTVKRKYAFHVGKVPPAIVKTVRHALAIDEQRLDFRPQVWKDAAPGQSLEQKWFPGAHSNAGGGYDPDGIANFSFQWMISEAARAESAGGEEKIGLQVDGAFARKFAPNPKGVLGDEHNATSQIVETLRGKRGEGRRSLRATGAGTVTIAEAAFRVMIENPSYRPANLLEDVRQHPEDLDVLGPADRARIQAILAETR